MYSTTPHFVYDIVSPGLYFSKVIRRRQAKKTKTTKKDTTLGECSIIEAERRNYFKKRVEWSTVSSAAERSSERTGR